jgi:protein-S-isoprenylcysteine O-methyltransferase Ste14
MILPGLLFDYWLSKIGAVRSAKQAVVIATSVLIFLKPFLFKSLSWWVYCFGVLLGILFAVHRTDLRETYKKGYWWWIKDKKTNNLVKRKISQKR